VVQNLRSALRHERHPIARLSEAPGDRIRTTTSCQHRAAQARGTRHEHFGKRAEAAVGGWWSPAPRVKRAQALAAEREDQVS